MSENHEILKLFTRKLANCRYKVPVNSVIQYMEKGQFGYNVQEGEDTVVTNDSVFASSIASVITHIRAIFKDPHIFLKKEETIQNIAVASHINNETLRMNYKDSKLWKTKALDTSPEFVHTFVYEDDYAIYENRFICYLMDELISIVTKKINEIKTSIETLNWKITNRKDVLGLPEKMYLNYADKAEDGVPVILPNTDCRVSVLDALIKNKKNLILLTNTPIYKACKKAGEFNILSLKTTNILLHDKHYNYCYDFYLNYLQRESEFTSESNMFKNFAVVNMICALNRAGFVCEKDNAELLVSNAAMVKFKEIAFIKEPFKIVLEMGEKNDFSVTVKNLVSGSTIQHFVKVVHTTCEEIEEGATASDIFAAYKQDAGLDDHNAWLITDVDMKGEGVVRIQPTAIDAIDTLVTLIKKFTLLAEGALSVYTCLCPVCGSNLVTPDEKDYYCVDCESTYHLFYYATRDLIWIKRLPKIAEEVEEPIVEEKVVVETVTQEVEKIEEVDVQEIVVQPKAEEVAPTETPAIFAGDEAFASHIKRHFYAKVSQLEVEKKEYYNELKNYILQYKKINVRASWSYETFSNRRIPKVRLAVRGKTLVAFFALDPKEYENTKYFPKDMGDTKKFEETPMMVKVQSERGVKFAKELIDIALADLEKNEAYEAADYMIPYKSDKQLFEEGLIKIVGDVELSDYVRNEPVKEEPVIEEKVEETVVEEPAIEEIVEETVVEEKVEEAVVEEPVVEEKVEETVVEEPAIEEIVEETVVEETIVAETFIKETLAVEEVGKDIETEDIANILSNDAFASHVKRHFLAKLSHLEEEKKDYYNELKNYALQYKKVSARASWNYETFSTQRIPKVRLAVRGKTLVALFALDPKAYEDTKYFPKDMGDTKKFEETPMMVKVQSERGVKFAKELIDIVFADLEMNENYKAVDYKVPYKSDQQLLAEDLIKIVGDVELSDYVREETGVVVDTAEPVVEEAVEEVVVEEPAIEETVEEVVVEEPAIEEAVVEAIVEEPVVETPAAPAVVETIVEERVIEQSSMVTPADEARLKRHFLAKISQMEDSKKEYYSELKNHVLQYKKVSARASWGYETFSNRRNPKVRLAVRGKTLVALFALDPKEYENTKYFPKDMSDTKKFADTPMMVKVKSERGLKFAKELIDIALADLVKDEAYVKGDYKIIYKTDKELFAEGLIKVNGDPIAAFADGDNVKTVVRVPVAAVEETVAEPVVEETVVEETVAEPVVEETVVEETVVEPVVEEAVVEETVAESVVEEAVVEETVAEPVVEEVAVAEPVVEEEETPAEDKEGFAAKFGKIKKKRKVYYDELRAYILGFSGVKSFISSDNESFTADAFVKARLIPNGKFVAICLPLDAKDYKKQFKMVEETATYTDTPMMVTLKAPRDVERIKELLDTLLN